jgi:hypothetical protein
MALHLFRVTVSGQFDRLDDTTRADLVAHAADHVVAKAAFTRDGTFTYELPLTSFSYRYEVRVDGGADHDAPIEVASARAEAAALGDLDARGITARRLRVQPTDMADVWRRGSR